MRRSIPLRWLIVARRQECGNCPWDARHEFLRARHNRVYRALNLLGDTIMGDRDRWQIFLPMVEAFCSSVGFAPKTSIEANEGAAIFRLVAAGQGVSIYPSCARQAAFGDLAVRSSPA